jgi:hypothetical protein
VLIEGSYGKFTLYWPLPEFTGSINYYYSNSYL